MIDIKHLVGNIERYREELIRRGGNPDFANEAASLYEDWKNQKSDIEPMLKEKNDFNKTIWTLSEVEKNAAFIKMKDLSAAIKEKEDTVKGVSESLKWAVAKIPNLSWDGIPIGKSDLDNPVTNTWGEKPQFSFEAKPYYELDVYKKYVDQKTWAEVMWARWYFMRWEMAKFQKVLFNWVEQIIWDNGIPSSEQPLMWYYAKKHVGDLKEPILVMANTTCFRKESGSYGKDQQGILRVHQFEKIEIDALCRPEDSEKVFALNAKINEEIYTKLWLHFRAVEVCSWDMPAKHHRQVDYEAWFPGEGKFREVCSNGAASDYQTRGLKTSYNNDGQKEFAWSLNCTAVTFRTGLAIMEQFQTADGKVEIPEVLRPFMWWKTHLG